MKSGWLKRAINSAKRKTALNRRLRAQVLRSPSGYFGVKP